MILKKPRLLEVFFWADIKKVFGYICTNTTHAIQTDSFKTQWRSAYG